MIIMTQPQLRLSRIFPSHSQPRSPIYSLLPSPLSPIRCKFFSSSSTSSFSLLRPKKWKVLFMGTDNISLRTLEKLHDQVDKQKLIEGLEVICIEEKCPVRSFASSQGLKIHTVPHSLKSLAGWRSPGSFDIGVVVSFGFFIPKTLLNDLPFGGLNMHPSLLPKYRGAAPIYHSLLSGDTTTGVSIIELDPHRFDAGRILRQIPFSLPPADHPTSYSSLEPSLSSPSPPPSIESHHQSLRQLFSYSRVSDSLARLGADQIIFTLENFDTLRHDKNIITQDESKVSNAPKVKKENGLLSFSKMSRLEVLNRSRAFGDTIGVFGFLLENPKRRVTFFDLYPLPDFILPSTGLVPGSALFIPASSASNPSSSSPFPSSSPPSVSSSSNSLYPAEKHLPHVLAILCEDGKWVGCDRFQFDGRKVISAPEFWVGYSKYRINNSKALHFVDHRPSSSDSL